MQEGVFIGKNMVQVVMGEADYVTAETLAQYSEERELFSLPLQKASQLAAGFLVAAAFSGHKSVVRAEPRGLAVVEGLSRNAIHDARILRFAYGELPHEVERLGKMLVSVVQGTQDGIRYVRNITYYAN